jgi:DNA-binding GntR family transcriptional regulator
MPAERARARRQSESSVSPVTAGLDVLWRRHSRGLASADAVHAVLREAILSGLLQPGERLAEETLAAQFGVSRTPVHEALARLEAEHVATRLSRRGLVVSSVTEEQILEVYAIRAVLDGLAARLAASNALPSELVELRGLHERLADLVRRDDLGGVVRANMDLHEALCRAAHSEMLLHFTHEIHSWVRRFGETSYPGRGDEMLDEHAAILAAIEARNPRLAERQARNHMENNRRVRLLLLDGSLLSET